MINNPLSQSALLKNPLSDPKIQIMIDQKRSTDNFFDKSYLDKSSHQIIDYFLIVGAPPDIKNEGDASPRILFIYPSNDLKLTSDDLIIIPQFCFPLGYRKSNLAFDSKKPVESEFIFRLHQSGLYGMCSRCLVNPSRIPFFASKETIDYPFCYCIISKYPAFSVQFTILFYFARLIDRIVDPAGDRKLKKERTKQTPDYSIPNMVTKKKFIIWEGINIPSLVKKELSFLYGIHKYTSENTCVSIELSEDMKVLVPSYLDYDELIGNFCFDILFSCLSIPNIVRLFTYVLLEEGTIVYSKSIEKVTFSILALIALFHNFNLLNNIYSILPQSHQFVLQSPFPYLVGVTWRPGSDYTRSKCFVNLDKDRIEQETISVEIPRSEILIEKLSKIFEKYEEVINVPNPIMKNKYINFLKNAHVYSRPFHSLTMYQTKYVIHPSVVRKIIRCFVNEFYSKLNETVLPYFVSDTTDRKNPVTIFDKDFFIKCVEKRQKEFYELFIQTSIFDMYTENKIEELMKRKKSKE